MNLLLLCSCGSLYIQTAPKPERYKKDFTAYMCGPTILGHARFSFHGLDLEYGCSAHTWSVEQNIS